MLTCLIVLVDCLKEVKNMLKPKFKIDNDTKLYITDKYMSNGHWLVIKNNLRKEGKTLFKKYLKYAPDTYFADTPSGNGLTNEKMELVIPKRDGYSPLKAQPNGVSFQEIKVLNQAPCILAYKYENTPMIGEKSFEIGINPIYATLFNLGHAFAKDPKSPILVLDSSDLNGNLIAVVMPMTN